MVGLGFLFLGMGAIGVFIPVWPTTPFVLVSAACFSSTPRLRERIMKIGFFREYIESYESGGGISRKTMTVSLCYLWGMLLISMLFIKRLWVILLLAVVGISVTIHIVYMYMKRRKKEKGKDGK